MARPTTNKVNMVKLTNESIFYDKTNYAKINYGKNKHEWNNYGKPTIVNHN